MESDHPPGDYELIVSNSKQMLLSRCLLLHLQHHCQHRPWLFYPSYGRITLQQFRTCDRYFHLNRSLLSITHYQTLGISKGASQAEIKKAYYDLSMKYHPDKGEGIGSEEKFRGITSAYEVLGNPRLRRMYDKGLLSSNGDELDASVHYPTESTEPLKEMSPEEVKRMKRSMQSFDRWSVEQISKGFKRTQKERFITGAKFSYREYRDNTMGEMKFLMVIIGIIILVTVVSLDFPKRFDSSRSKTDNSSNTDKRKKS